MEVKSTKPELVIEESDGVLTVRSSGLRIAKILGVSLIISIIVAVLTYFLPAFRLITLGVIFGSLAFLISAYFSQKIEKASGVYAFSRFIFLLLLMFFGVQALVGFIYLNFPLIASIIWIPTLIICYLWMRTHTSFTKSEYRIHAVRSLFKDEFSLKPEDIRSLEMKDLGSSSYFKIKWLTLSGPFLSAADKRFINDKLKEFVGLDSPFLEHENTFEENFEKAPEKVKAKAAYKTIDQA